MTERSPGSPPRPDARNWRTAAMMLGALVVAVFVGANAHLIYVAFASRPDCVAHGKPTGDAGNSGSFGAAQSSC
ncbi:hypothetical protein FZC33_05980 [Labrys sp. KNU-23]|uniref:hypothetical protein n=1 Tax=Labrys sp. KNU-23 TaxID=2789216 RepID=UPI0011ECA854|nr:hypothetical protein [Labrys sp. KNU-23]QEN85780.1 hypothetical protein FZC33_05980 [Labrys sp. KNU-23]